MQTVRKAICKLGPIRDRRATHKVALSSSHIFLLAPYEYGDLARLHADPTTPDKSGEANPLLP